MRKYFKHLLVFLLIVSMTIPIAEPLIPAQTAKTVKAASKGKQKGKAKGTNKNKNIYGWWNAELTCKDNETVVQRVYRGRKFLLKKKNKKYVYLNDSIPGVVKNKKTFIVKKKMGDSYAFYLCWIIVNDLTDPATDGVKSVDNHKFNTHSGSWETCGYVVTSEKVKLGDDLTKGKKHFYVNLTTNGLGKYSSTEKQKSGSGLYVNLPSLHTNPKTVCGHTQIWKDPKKRRNDYGVVLHYHCLYNPKDTSNCLMGQVMENNYKKVSPKNYPKNGTNGLTKTELQKRYPFGYVKAYIHAIPAKKTQVKSKPKEPHPYYEYTDAHNLTTSKGEITRAWNQPILIPLFPTVRIRAVDLSTNKVIKLDKNFLAYLKKNDKRYHSDKKIYGDDKIQVTTSGQLVYDAQYFQSRSVKTAKELDWTVKVRWQKDGEKVQEKTLPDTKLSADPKHRNIRYLIRSFKKYVETKNGPLDKLDNKKLEDGKKEYIPVGIDACVSNLNDFSPSSSNKTKKYSRTLYPKAIEDMAYCKDPDYGSTFPSYPLYGHWAYYYNGDAMISEENAKWISDGKKLYVKQDKYKGWTYRLYPEFYKNKNGKMIDRDWDEDYLNISEDITSEEFDSFINRERKMSNTNINFVIAKTGMKFWDYEHSFIDKNSNKFPQYVVTLYYLGAKPPTNQMKPKAFKCWYLGDNTSITSIKSLPRIKDPGKTPKLELPIGVKLPQSHKLIKSFERDDLGNEDFPAKIREDNYDENGIVYSLHGYNIQSVKMKGSEFTKVDAIKLSADSPWNKSLDATDQWITPLKKHCTKGHTEDLFYAIVPPVVTAVFTQHYKEDGTYYWKKELGFTKPTYYLNGATVKPNFGDISKYTVTGIKETKKNGTVVKRELLPNSAPVSKVARYVDKWKVEDYDGEPFTGDAYKNYKNEDIDDNDEDDGEFSDGEPDSDDLAVDLGDEDDAVDVDADDTDEGSEDNSDVADTDEDEGEGEVDDEPGIVNDVDDDTDFDDDDDDSSDTSGSTSTSHSHKEDNYNFTTEEIDSWRRNGKPFENGDSFIMPKRSTLAVLFLLADSEEDNSVPPPTEPEPFESTEPQSITPTYHPGQPPLQEKTYTDNDPGFPGPNLSDNPTVIHSGHNDFNGSRQTKTEVTYFDLSKLEKYGTANKSYYHNHQGKPWTYMDERWDYNDGQPWIYSKTSDVALPLVGMQRNAKISIKTDEKRSSKDKNGNTFDAEKNIATSEYLKTYGELNKYEVNIEIKKIKTTYRYSGTFTYVRWECHQHTKTCRAECKQILDCNDSGVCPDCQGHVVVTKNGSYTWYHHHSGGCQCNWEKHIYTITGEQKRDTIYYELADGAAYYPSDYTVWNDVLGDPGQQTVFEHDKGGQGEPISWKQNLGFSYTKGHSWEPSNHAVWWVSPSAGGGNPGCSGGGKTQDDDRKCVVPYLADRWKCFWCNNCKKDPLYTKAEADARINQAIANDEAAQNGKIIFNDGEGHTQSLANQTTYKYCYVPGWLKKLSDPCDKKYLVKDGIKIPKDSYNGLHNSNYYASKYSLGNKADIYWGDNDAAHGGVDYYDPTATVHYTLSPRGHQGVAVSSPKQEKFFHNDYAYAVPVNDVRVHTPTVCNAWIISDQSQVQTLDYKPGLPLDRWFYVHIDATGDNIDDPGYGEQDYSRYLNDGVVDGQICKVGYVRFDFAVLRQDSGKWSYYNPNVWIPCRLGDTLFYLPTTDHMVDSATVTYQTRAENSWITDAYDKSVATGVTSTDRNTQIFYKKRVSRVEDVANLQNDNYVGTTTEDWALTGRIYNFKIDDITDYPVWKKEFRDSEGKLRWNSLHSGLYDRDDFQRYSDPLQTLVPVTGTNDEHPNQTALNTGYAFRYSFETVGDFEDKNDSITIVPKFSWVDKDGKNRTSVSVYYNDKIGDSYKHLVKVGSSLDKTNRKPFSISQYGIGQDTLDSTAKANGYAETEKFTSIKTELFCPSTIHLPWTLHTYDGWYHKSNLVGGERADFDVNASKADFGLNAPQETFTSLKEAVAQFGEQGKVYASEGSVVTRNDIYTSVQDWYGEYYLPSDIYVTDATDAQVKTATSDEFTGKESIWKQDGYLVVNFEIIANDGGKPYIGYDNTYKDYGNAYGEEFGLHYGTGLDTSGYGGTVPYDLVTLGTCNMWNHEGFQVDKKDIDGKHWNFKTGDVVMYDIKESRDASAKSAYTSGGTH